MSLAIAARHPHRMTYDTALLPALLQLLETLIFPVAIFDPAGSLRAANRRFHQLVERLLIDADPAAVHNLYFLGARLGVLFDDSPSSGPLEIASPSGRVVTVTATRTADGGVTLCAQDITDQRRAERIAERSQKVAIVALADLAEHRDTDTGEHVLRVARLTHEIARYLYRSGLFQGELTADFLRHVGTASILHDVGKVSIPDSILLKPGLLTPDERSVMERHAKDGAVILRKAEALLLTGSLQFRLASEIAASHHERWDGAGYPAGLSGTDIPLAARIVAVADCKCRN